VVGLRRRKDLNAAGAQKHFTSVTLQPHTTVSPGRLHHNRDAAAEIHWMPLLHCIPHLLGINRDADVRIRETCVTVFQTRDAPLLELS
jgi:hypothetical protein